ncbi:hypothetical protein EZS27_043429, partial [termite gut metagenome]
NKNSRMEFIKELDEDYRLLREKHNRSVVGMVSLEEARKKKLKRF